jgi:beta-galactosidase
MILDSDVEFVISGCPSVPWQKGFSPGEVAWLGGCSSSSRGDEAFRRKAANRVSIKTRLLRWADGGEFGILRSTIVCSADGCCVYGEVRLDGRARVEVPCAGDVFDCLAERIRAFDDTRYVTNGVNPIISVGIQTIIEMASPATGDAVDADEENAGVNTVMQRLRTALPLLLQSETVAKKLDEAYSYLDVAGYNYSDARYEADGNRMPNRVIVGTETHNTNIAQNWPKVLELPHVIGDFTWTGWDYLGEVGLGRVEYGENSGLLMGDYPWLAAWCADIDITGQRRALSYLRETVFGLRSEPHVSVRDPARHGATPSHLGLAGEPWLEGLASWSWPGFEGRPVTVDVMSDADEVELLVNGTSVGRQPAGKPHRFCAKFETTFELGEIVAVAYRDGAEVARTALRSGTGLAGLDVRADRTQIRADDTDLAYIDIALVDGEGRLHHAEDRAVTVEIEGSGELLGLGSANPRTEETFGEPTHHTFNGRALAVVRPTAPGTVTVTVTVTTAGIVPQQVTIDVG